MAESLEGSLSPSLGRVVEGLFPPFGEVRRGL